MNETLHSRQLTFAQRVSPFIPARLEMWLRAYKNRRDLFGLHAPPSTLMDLVPEHRVAVDVGAAHGLYTYFIAKRASTVWAFEPNPVQFARLKRGASRNTKPFRLAISDTAGEANLYVPPSGLGEASLEIHAERGDARETYSVETRTLDSFDIPNVGFIKVDVEGHEEAVLRGAERTIASSRPTIFIELEDRHSSGVVHRVVNFLGERGYSGMQFLHRGQLRPIGEFDLGVHQASLAGTPSHHDYVSNFVFTP